MYRWSVQNEPVSYPGSAYGMKTLALVAIPSISPWLSSGATER